jgi:hypothetical protein
MPDPNTATYQVRSSGLWNRRHEISGPEGPLGVLTLERGPLGVIRGGVYRPEKGELLRFRREPGILRSQFSVWTEGGEWLCSSIRRHFLHREVELWTGPKPHRLLPLEGLRRGWRLIAPKTGEQARLVAGHPSRIEVSRRVDFELLLFSWFLGAQILWESLPPGPAIDATPESLAAASKA